MSLNVVFMTTVAAAARIQSLPQCASHSTVCSPAMRILGTVHIVVQPSPTAMGLLPSASDFHPAFLANFGIPNSLSFSALDNTTLCSFLTYLPVRKGCIPALPPATMLVRVVLPNIIYPSLLASAFVPARLPLACLFPSPHTYILCAF